MTRQPPFWRLDIHEALPSTSDLCRLRAEAGEREGLAVLARQQTGGRGTHGRGWMSPPGNLFLSVLLRPGGSAREAGLWGLLAAVAVAEAVAPLLPDPDGLRLKWPNDVLSDGAKLAGLLSEASLRTDGAIDWLVIGMGVNLLAAPTVPDRPTACVGPDAPAPELFARELLARLDTWRTSVALDGWDSLRAAWLARGPAIGAPIAVRVAGVTHEGRFAGLAEDGALLLSTSGRVRAFAAGET